MYVHLRTQSPPPPPHTLVQWGFNGAVGIAAGSVYEVSSATLSDAGEYTCTAGNSRGLAQNSITLTVFIATAQGDSSVDCLSKSFSFSIIKYCICMHACNILCQNHNVVRIYMKNTLYKVLTCHANSFDSTDWVFSQVSKKDQPLLHRPLSMSLSLELLIRKHSVPSHTLYYSLVSLHFISSHGL